MVRARACAGGTPIASPFRFQPPNAEIEVLTTAGVVGLLGFRAHVVVPRVAWRLDPAYGTLAVAVLVSRLVQGQFDLFWAASQGSLPFMIVGVCLGMQAHAAAAAPQPVGRSVKDGSTDHEPTRVLTIHGRGGR